MKSFKFLIIFLIISKQKVNSGGAQLYYLTFCNSFYDIFDASGKYQGTSCFLNIAATWNDAKAICEANHMYLLKVLNTAVQTNILNSAASIYGTKPVQNIWINAAKDSVGIWYSYDGSYSYKMLSSGRLSWVDSSASKIGNCMTITNQIGPYKVSSNNCNQKLPFICTFNRTIT
ncbi:hypothetical protein PVAND_016077 [Polypedilum vanderplanki]|uniref:C-type lectin domain-containing protein n=1 Tax=Polypedilum vanderplanki TaxID=319348 RepID=A0A9J6BE26_POLVA|nr:hypothetical protein PVAND_016077 [Polypedilum vanderplanki]